MSETLIPRQPIDRDALLQQIGDNASWRDTLKNAWVIARRELNDSFRDWRIITPIFLLTLIFPFLGTIATGMFFNLIDQYDADAELISRTFLPLMPMIVGFFPISISLVIALESFVGEKERRSLEPLLATPLTNLELYIGKVLAAMIPPLLASYMGMAVYIIGLGIAPARNLYIDPIILLQIVVLTTAQAMVMVTGSVVISSQTTSTRAANLLASIIILPMSLITIMESLIIINRSQRYLLWWVALLMAIVVFVLIRTGIRIFNRE